MGGSPSDRSVSSASPAGLAELEARLWACEQNIAATLDMHRARMLAAMERGDADEATRIRISCVQPWLNFFREYESGGHYDRCEVCGGELRAGMMVRAFEDTGAVHADCGPDQQEPWKHDEIDWREEVRKAKAAIAELEAENG
jgi:hypothetical protein